MAGDDDLPEELPSWMIVETEPDQPPFIGSVDDTEESEDGDSEDTYQTFTPREIEASIADLATPESPETPFAEDQFEMAGEGESLIEDNQRGG